MALCILRETECTLPSLKRISVAANKRYPSLDGLRAVSISMVFIAHCGRNAECLSGILAELHGRAWRAGRSNLFRDLRVPDYHAAVAGAREDRANFAEELLCSPRVAHFPGVLHLPIGDCGSRLAWGSNRSHGTIWREPLPSEPILAGIGWILCPLLVRYRWKNSFICCGRQPLWPWGASGRFAGPCCCWC